eukprot:5560900-Pyramimonas_sp.AAC.1
MSQAVCSFSCPTSFVFRADCGDVPGGALVSAPLKEAARSAFTGPFAASLRGCLKRFARFHAQHSWLSEQIVRMSRARRSFQRGPFAA